MSELICKKQTIPTPQGQLALIVGESYDMFIERTNEIELSDKRLFSIDEKDNVVTATFVLNEGEDGDLFSVVYNTPFTGYCEELDKRVIMKLRPVKDEVIVFDETDVLSKESAEKLKTALERPLEPKLNLNDNCELVGEIYVVSREVHMPCFSSGATIAYLKKEKVKFTYVSDVVFTLKELTNGEYYSFNIIELPKILEVIGVTIKAKAKTKRVSYAEKAELVMKYVDVKILSKEENLILANKTFQFNSLREGAISEIEQKYKEGSFLCEGVFKPNDFKYHPPFVDIRQYNKKLHFFISELLYPIVLDYIESNK